MSDPLIGYLLLEPHPANRPGTHWRRTLVQWWRPCARYPEFAYGGGSQLWRAELRGVGRDDAYSLHPEPLRCSGYTLIEQLPAWRCYGPRGAAVAELLTQARSLTLEGARELAVSDGHIAAGVPNLNRAISSIEPPEAGGDLRLYHGLAKATGDLRTAVERHEWAIKVYPDSCQLLPPWDAALYVLQQRARRAITDA